MDKIYDSVVIGMGVAGMSSAIYLKRSGLNVLIIEKNMPGGQIVQTGIVDNYPGFKGDGPTLALDMYAQITENKIEQKFDEVIELEKKDNIFKIKTSTEEIISKTVILATGRTANKLKLPNEEELTGRGVSYCVICDGAFYKDKVVAVVGSGNSALEEGLSLTKLCSKVIFIVRSEEFKGSSVLIEKIKNSANVEILYNTEIESINEEEGFLSSITVQNKEKKLDLDVSGLFIYIGFSPKINYLNKLSVEENNGYIVTRGNGKTNIEGLYACGDSIKKQYYQISIAVGEGASTALEVDTYLKKN